jgi:ribose transport system ATP-binding protein
VATHCTVIPARRRKTSGNGLAGVGPGRYRGRMPAVPQTNAAAAPLVRMSGIGKAFGAVQVLHDVRFDLQTGESHALVGENGAGKSTLIKILAGVHTDYVGQITVRGTPVRFRGPRDAENAGIAVIHQELALVPHLSAAENIYLGREPVNCIGLLRRRRMETAAAIVLRDTLGIELDVRRPVAELPVASQQLVEIAKALARDAAILVMDEPTSALSEADAQRLFTAMGRLRARGVGIIYISHRMDEIYRVADRITVLRDGRYVGTAAACELSQGSLVQWMVGREIAQLAPRADVRCPDERLRVTDLWLRDAHEERWVLREFSVSVKRGEVVGLAGLMGSGASEALGAVFGRYGRPARGTVLLDGRPMQHFTPAAALDAGMALLTNDRKASGLVLPMSVLHNASLSVLPRCRRAGLLSGTRERRTAGPLLERLCVRAPSLHTGVSALSGGNQQKVLLARWLMVGPRVLLLDEPTRGIDVGAKADIYALLGELTAAGLGILLITSELPELLALADRIVVLHRGRITGEFTHAEATAERIMHAAMGNTR